MSRPFSILWTLRPSAPQPLLQSLDTAERAGPAATTRAAGPSAVSGHCGLRRRRPSGDHARRRPFCSLWTLRREPAQRRPRAPQALLQSLDTAAFGAAGPSAVSGHCGESRPSGDHARRRPCCSLWTLRRQPAQRRPRTRAAGPSAVSGHCGESRPSGDHARRRPFCSLWTLRREPAQRRPRAPQALLQSLDTAGPSAVSSVME